MSKELNKLNLKPFIDNDGQPFTNRESECLCYMLLGNTIKETARALEISPRTVEVYINIVKNKLRCFSRSQIISKISMQKDNQDIIADLFHSFGC